MKPLCIELYAGLHGWGEGFIAEGYRVKGFDIVDMCEFLGKPRPEGIELILADVRSLHGSQFKDAMCIVASPPCTEYSYMAMPWSRGKQIARALRGNGEFPEGYTGSRTIDQLNELFNACFRIQHEACEASGRYIPLIVENVRGAQPWVGRSAWNFGSYHLWGDVPALMPIARAIKVGGFSWSDFGKPNYKPQGFNVTAAQKVSSIDVYSDNGQSDAREEIGLKLPIGNCSERRWEDRPVKRLRDAVKSEGGWFGGEYNPTQHGRNTGSGSKKRKQASAEIAKIPFPLAQHIARCFYPNHDETLVCTQNEAR